MLHATYQDSSPCRRTQPYFVLQGRLLLLRLAVLLSLIGMLQSCELIWRSERPTEDFCGVEDLAAGGTWLKGCGQPAYLNNVSALAARYSASRFAVKTGGQGPKAVQSLCDVARHRDLLSWGLSFDTGCSLVPWSSEATTRALSGKRLVFVGDSLSEQAVSSFLLLAEQSGHRIEVCPSLVRDAFSLSSISCHAVDSFYVVLVYVKADLVNDQLQPVSPEEARQCRARTSANASVSWADPSVEKKWFLHRKGTVLIHNACYTNSWLAAVEQADVVILNFGHWYHHYDNSGALYKTIADNILLGLEQSFKGAFVIFRSTTSGLRPAPDADCSHGHRFLNFTKPLSLEELAEQRKQPDDKFRWRHLSALEDYWQTKAIGQRSRAWKLVFLDVRSWMDMRVDGHVDCVHFCPVGPMLWVGRAVHHTIMKVVFLALPAPVHHG